MLQAADGGERPSDLKGVERRRLAGALLLSLLIHVLLLTLAFDGAGLGPPGLRFPWEERRVEVPELRVRIVPPEAPAEGQAAASIAEPPPQASTGQALAVEPDPTPAAPSVPRPRGADEVANETKPTAQATPDVDGAVVADAKAPTRADPVHEPVAGPTLEPDVMAVEQPDERTFEVPPAPPEPIAPVAPAQTASSVEIERPVPRDADSEGREAARLQAERQEAARQAAAREEAVAREEAAAREQAAEAARQEAARADAARLEAERQEAARQAATLEEAARQEATRQEAARAEAARLEAERQEAARQEAARAEAARLEAERQEAARQEAARAEAARLEAERQEAARQAAAGEEAARQEAARAEAARLETERQEAARQEAARQEDARQEAARQEAARQEAARQEAARTEAARLEAERQEAARRVAAGEEAARREAARAEAARLEAERQEAARQAAAREEEARQEAARAEAARLQAEQQEAARQITPGQESARAQDEDEAAREARRRAFGKRLDEAAARREAATPTPQPDGRPHSWSSRRRARLFGRTDPNAELVLYAEAWARKIQLNMTFDMIREAAKRPHVSPVVTVAIRRDGSVESVTFVLSSGVPEIDEAVRRIVESQTPYRPFPPALARDFDVIEIRRTWHFDTAVRLH